MKKSLKKNATLNTIRTLFRIFIPLITIPYTTHILSVNSIGKYNFAASIVSYFVLLSQLGINTYAIREGAKYRESKEDFSVFVSEVFTINVITTILSYFLLFLIILLVPGFQPYKLLLIILSAEIILNTLGCEWVYAINEEYKYITIRSLIFQVIYIILLFLFVNNQSDLLLYCFVMVIATAGPNIPNILGLKKRCNIKIVFNKKIFKHFIPILLLFANSIATTIYGSSDNTILGLIAGDYYVGIYSISTKIYITVKNVLAALIVVSIPRLSYLYGNNKTNEFSKLANKIINSLIFLVLPAVVGLICVSESTILLLAGKKFIDGVLSLQILCITCIFSLFGLFYSSCILIPGKRDKDVLFATALSAILNIILNIILISKYKHNAAAFTTLFAETLSFIIFYFKSKKVANISVSINCFVKTILGCLGIVICCYFLNNYLSISLCLKLIIQIILSGIVYVIIELLLKNESLNYFIDMIPDKIKRKFRKII